MRLPLGRMYRDPDFNERFWDNVYGGFQSLSTTKSNRCWFWKGALDRDGYGSIKRQGVARQAHRASWEVHEGEVPEGLCVLHHCDEPSCVRPDHLFLGTRADNNKDRAAKGRTRGPMIDGSMNRAGVKNGRAKLTPDQVKEIRRRCAAGESQSSVAKDFHVVQPHVSRIVREVVWNGVR